MPRDEEQQVTFVVTMPRDAAIAWLHRHGLYSHRRRAHEAMEAWDAYRHGINISRATTYLRRNMADVAFEPPSADLNIPLLAATQEEARAYHRALRVITARILATGPLLTSVEREVLDVAREALSTWKNSEEDPHAS